MDEERYRCNRGALNSVSRALNMRSRDLLEDDVVYNIKAVGVGIRPGECPPPDQHGVMTTRDVYNVHRQESLLGIIIIAISCVLVAQSL